MATAWLKDRTFTPEGFRTVHHMEVELTLDYPSLQIQDATATMHENPFPTCPQAVARLDRLRGLRVGPGFAKQVRERIGLEESCTHIGTLVQQAAAVVALSHVGILVQGKPDLVGADRRTFYQEVLDAEPDIVGSCHVWAQDGPALQWLQPPSTRR